MEGEDSTQSLSRHLASHRNRWFEVLRTESVLCMLSSAASDRFPFESCALKYVSSELYLEDS